MPSEPSLPDLYRSHGFTVTPYLQDLIDTYGEMEVVSPVEPQTRMSELRNGTFVPLTPRRRAIEFCPRDCIESGRDHYNESAEAFMGMPVTPVGFDNDVIMLLTEDGRLVGWGDAGILAWGPRDCDWRTSVAAYLNGAEDRLLGHWRTPKSLPPEEQNAPLAELYRTKGFTLTPHLLELIETYGETARVPTGEESAIRADGTLNWARAPEEAIQFGVRRDIVLGADFHMLQKAGRFLGSPVAPVGRTHGDYWWLLLTEDGRLVAFEDFSLRTWGPEGCDWRTSIAARLAGEPARELGWAGR